MAFKPGESGNPTGRPKGIQDRRTRLRGLLEPHTTALVDKAVELALAGDVAAIKLCMDRLIPTVRPQELPVRFQCSGKTPSEMANNVIAAASAGELAPDDASKILNALTGLIRIREVDELDKRVRALEGRDEA